MESRRVDGLTSINEVFHKEKNQKKNNKTKGQYDKLKKYGNDDELSSGKLTTDKLIKREALYMKNIRIDKAYESLLRMNVITEGKNRDWYFKCLHKLGVTFVMAQAELSLKNSRDKNNPGALFHFLINKEMNRSIDPYMPRF